VEPAQTGWNGYNPPCAPHCLFPAGIRIAETYPEMIVSAEPGEQFGFMDGISDPAAYAGSIVKDQQRRDTAYVFMGCYWWCSWMEQRLSVKMKRIRKMSIGIECPNRLFSNSK